MKIRRLSDAGIERFGVFLDSLKTEAPEPFPNEIMSNTDMSELVQPEIEIEQRNFINRFEVAEYLNQVLAEAEIPNIERDRGLWAWLAMFYFDQLCPPESSGQRKPGERARWILAVGDFRKYYRHLLAGPYRIYRAHRDNPSRAFALLCTPAHRPGDIAEQLASRQELVTNTGVMEAATTLYVDDETEKPKRGAAGRGPGSARRLADVLNQFDVAWDLYSMETEDLIKILPDEFDRFRPQGK
jgi:hypothetical protein